MRVLVLSQNSSPILDIIKEMGDEVVEYRDTIDIRFLEKYKIDMIVSHGYRHLLKQPVLGYFPDRIINLHISLLPWNRGADPNLWSYLENTPRGVTIHFIDKGVDTGDIISQKEVYFSIENETLATSYMRLQDEILMLFEKTWPLIRTGKNKRIQQPKGGTLHKSIDKNRFEHLLIKGWDTPVLLISGKGLSNQE